MMLATIYNKNFLNAGHNQTNTIVFKVAVIIDSVKNEGQLFHIFIPSIKTKVSREFLITVRGFKGVNMDKAIQKRMRCVPIKLFLGFSSDTEVVIA